MAFNNNDDYFYERNASSYVASEAQQMSKTGDSNMIHVVEVYIKEMQMDIFLVYSLLLNKLSFSFIMLNERLA
jgi:hypothetical protein